MRIKGLLFGTAAVFTLALLWTAATVPSSGLALAAPLTGSVGGSAADGNGSPIEGRRIFVRENCYSCHGGFAGGNMCPSLREDRPDEDEVREVVRNGTRNGMPPFPELTELDIINLAAYFETLRRDNEPTFLHWWEPVPTQ
jgi:mono/diheme cytochrome c family protein